MYRNIFTLIIMLLLITCSGCVDNAPSGDVKFQGYKAYAYHGLSSADAQYIRFRSASGVSEFELQLPKELPRLVVEYRAQVKAGQIYMRILNPEGNVIIDGLTDEQGYLKLYHSLRVSPGVYTVQTEYRDAVDGEISYTMYGYYR
jgi:hypothetical protein